MDSSKLRNGWFALKIYVDEIQDDQLVIVCVCVCVFVYSK